LVDESDNSESIVGLLDRSSYDPDVATGDNVDVDALPD